MAEVWTSGNNLNVGSQQSAGFGTRTAGVISAGYTTNYTARTEKYDGTVWSNGNNCNTARGSLAGFGTQTAGVNCGGFDNFETNSTEKYDGTTWTISGALNQQRRYNGGYGTQSAGLTSGGYVGGLGSLSTTELFNGSTWSTGNDMPTVKLEHGCSGTQTSALAFCGVSVIDSATGQTSSFSFNGTTWSTETSANTAKTYTAGSGSSSSDALSFGGGPTAAAITTSEQWNGSSWASASALNGGRCIHAASGNSSSNNSFTAGGYNNGLLNTSEYFTTSGNFYSHSASGGGIAGGSSPVRQLRTQNGSGGGIGGGTATIKQIVVFSMTGGGIAGGNASYVWNGSGYSTHIMSGGGIGGGSADVVTRMLFTASGGGVGGGTAPYSFTLPAFVIPLYWGIFNNNAVPITGGAASTAVKIMRSVDSFLYDWSDTTFKSVGWTTLATILVEINPINLAGYYKKEVDVAVWNDGWYWITVDYTGTPRQNSEIEVLIMDGKISDYRVSLNADITTSSRLAAASYTAPDNAGIAALPTLSEIEGSSVLAKQVTLDFVEKWILNKLVESPSGTWKLYDDDGVTVLKTWTWDSGTKIRTKAT